MTKPTLKVRTALVAVLALTVAGRASAHDEPIAATDPREATLVLHVVNYAALSRDVLNKAKDRVAIVYEAIGVRIVWVDSERPVRTHQDGRLHLTVMLLSRDMAQQKISAEGIKDDVLGQAHLPSGRAYIFCDRIATMPGAPTFLGIPLAHIIAHEMGHLVLQANSHSLSGIMRRNVDVHAMHLQSFDTAQARTISTTLMGLPAGATGR